MIIERTWFPGTNPLITGWGVYIPDKEFAMVVKYFFTIDALAEFIHSELERML